MQCVVLAGGLGTRVRNVTGPAVPKALVSVAGTPFVDHQLQLLAAQGFTDVVLCVGYLGGQVEAYVGDGSSWGLPVRYSVEEGGLRGTAGALKLACERGLVDEVFAVVYGDSYLPCRARDAWAAFICAAEPALMTVFRNEGRYDQSNVAFSEGMVALYEKGSDRPGMRYIDYGMSIVERSLVEGRVSAGIPSDLADLFHELSIDGLLAGFEVRERFFEVGSVQGIADLEDYLRHADGSALG